jgi:hypothetical protein
MNLFTRMTGDRDAARLNRMFILPMTSFSHDETPPIILNELDDITNLHLRMNSHSPFVVLICPMVTRMLEL